MLPDFTNRKELGRYFAIGQVGLEMVVPIVVGLILDDRLGWTPWGVVGGAVLGLGGGLVHLVHLSGKAEVTDQSQAPKGKSESR
jgi:F0F1-type ATP synthase assembly protein I